MDWPLLIFLAFFGYIIYSMTTKHGKGRMFGGKILSSHDREIIQRDGINKTTIRVHLIEKKSGEKCVGIELSDNAKLAFSIRPITFTGAEARQFISMLEETANET